MPAGPALQPPDIIGRRRSSFLTRNLLGMVALLFGIAGLVTAILPPAVIKPPFPSLGSELKHVLLKAALDRPDPQTAAYHAALHNWQCVSIVLGLVAVVLAVIAGIRRQDRRLLASALSLGLAAILWQYIVVAVFAAFLVLALVAVAG